jgi:hypothetical protein
MIRALTILFALALPWAAVVAILFVGYADLPDPSLRCVPRMLDRLAARLPGQVSMPGDDGYAAATAIWSKPAGRMPDAVVHCQPLGLRTQEMLRTSTLLAEPSALASTRLWESPPSTM